MGKYLKITVIGAGAMGRQHVKAWKLAGHEVVSIADLDMGLAKELAEEFEIEKVYGDYKKAVEDPCIDIVSICLPLAMHAPVTIYAAENGKHVFCEKPLARSFEEVAQMEAAVKEAGVQFGIGFQRNFANSRKQVTQWAQEGKFGYPMVATSSSRSMVRPKRVMHDGNGNMGPIMDNCCHTFLMWQSVFGSKPKTIYARGGILAKDHIGLSHFEKLAIDTGIMIVEYESGDIAEMDISWGMPDGFKMKGHQDQIFGPKGGAEGVFYNVTEKLTLYEGDQKEEVSIDNNQNLHQVEFEAFATAIEKGELAPVSFQTGKEVLAVALAVLESIETGEVVGYSVPY